MKVYSLILILLTTLIGLDNVFARKGLPQLPKDVSLLIYYSGDNRLSDFMHSSYLRVLREGAGPNINVIVQFDGSDPNDSFRVSIGDKKVGSNYPEIFYEKNVEYDMGNPKTLVDFVKWGKTNFPAKRTMLVISSHGFGILNNPYPEFEKKKKGYIAKLASSIDDSSHSFMIEENLVAQLNAALSGQKLDLLVHNSCLMGSLESLSIMSSIAKFAITSEYSIYMNTNDDLISNEARTILIENIVSQIKDNPSATEREIGKKVVEDFKVNYKNFQAPTDTSEVIRFPSTMAFYDLGLIHSLSKLYSEVGKDFMQKASLDPRILNRFYDENLKARYVDSFGYIDLRTLFLSLMTALYPLSVKEKMQPFERLVIEVVPEREELYTFQPHPVSHLHVFFPSILTQADLKPFRRTYSQIKTVQYYGWPQLLDFFWTGLEKNGDEYWLSKLKLWNDGHTIVIKPTSTENEHDDDLFLQMDMLAIRLSRIPEQNKLKNYNQLLKSVRRTSALLEKHKDFAQKLLK